MGWATGAIGPARMAGGVLLASTSNVDCTYKDGDGERTEMASERENDGRGQR